MPEDLKYLAVAESSLLFHATSSKGAVGPWQFMNGTAEKNGLRTDRSLDERRDLEQSTEAALSYLKDLKEMFGTWSLAMAAYNCGESRIKKEIINQKENDFINLNFPMKQKDMFSALLLLNLLWKILKRTDIRYLKKDLCSC